MTDAVAILEAAYSLEGGEHAWLVRLGETVRRNVDNCRGVRTQTYDASSDALAIRETADCGLDEGMATAMLAKVALPASDHNVLAAMLRRRFVGSLRAAPAALVRSGLDAERVRQFEGNLNQFLHQWNQSDQWWVNAQDPTGLGCLIIAPRGSGKRLGPRLVHHWHCIAAHLASAFRVRRQFAAGRRDVLRGPEPAPEAVLRPDGTLEHAEWSAQDGEARGSLRSAVLALDRARGPLRWRDPEEAVQTWQALVAGRWSLLDHFDSDGRRFVVAHRNDAGVPDARGLTHRESQVLAQAALGQSNKMIAYELGLSTATVAGHLASGRGKLRLPSRAALRHEFIRSASRPPGADHVAGKPMGSDPDST